MQPEVFEIKESKRFLKIIEISVRSSKIPESILFSTLKVSYEYLYLVLEVAENRIAAGNSELSLDYFIIFQLCEKVKIKKSF
jgi:hypothetical protein